MKKKLEVSFASAVAVIVLLSANSGSADLIKAPPGFAYYHAATASDDSILIKGSYWYVECWGVMNTCAPGSPRLLNSGKVVFLDNGVAKIIYNGSPYYYCPTSMLGRGAYGVCTPNGFLRR